VFIEAKDDGGGGESETGTQIRWVKVISGKVSS